jgi:lycopene cyclase domain-containing protein
VDRFQYLALMGACLLITLPLEFILGARVYRRPRRLLATLAVPLVVFFVWDAIAIARDTWYFSTTYVTGWRVPLRVPVEEVVFFLVVPICALLTYEAVGRLLRSSHG